MFSRDRSSLDPLPTPSHMQENHFGLATMGPLQVVSHVVQNHLAGEQETHWDKTNKEHSDFKLVIRDSQVLAKLGVVTIFFIGWGGGV